MGGPPGVGNAAVRIKDLGQVEFRLVDELLELRNLADLLESVNLFLLVTVDGKASGVVAAVLETRESWIGQETSGQRPLLPRVRMVGQSWFQLRQSPTDIPLMSVSMTNFRSFSTR